MDAAGNLMLADQQDNRIRLVSPDGTIYTVAGAVGDPQTPESALGTPVANAVSLAPAPGGSMYFVENGARRVRILEPIPER